MKAKITLPNNTQLDLEGTAEEIARVVEATKYPYWYFTQPATTWLPFITNARADAAPGFDPSVQILYSGELTSKLLPPVGYGG